MNLLKYSNRTYRQTLILITHDQEIALQADRIIRLEDGRIVSDAPMGDRGTDMIWKEYSRKYLKDHRVSSVSIMAAAFVSSCLFPS